MINDFKIPKNFTVALEISGQVIFVLANNPDIVFSIPGDII